MSRNKKQLKISDFLEPITKITEETEALKYKEDYISFVQHQLNKHPEINDITAEEFVNVVFIYYASHFEEEKRETIIKMFHIKDATDRHMLKAGYYTPILHNLT